MADARRAWLIALGLMWATTQLCACGGGGGGGNGSAPPPSGLGTTTFIGNLSQPAAAAAADGAVPAGASPVQVCVAGTSFCTSVDENGVFTLGAGVGGDVVLVFDGPGFTASLALQDVPRGATVRIQNIECSTSTGLCHAEDVTIVSSANSPPLCDAALANPAQLWPPNHALVGIAIDGVVDPDGDPVTIEVTQVSQDEPINGEGSGDTAPDAQLAPLAVRAERSGQGNGRVYTIAFEASDNRGGSCSGVVQVCVPHDQGHGAACVDDGARFDSLGP